MKVDESPGKWRRSRDTIHLDDHRGQIERIERQVAAEYDGIGTDCLRGIPFVGQYAIDNGGDHLYGLSVIHWSCPPRVVSVPAPEMQGSDVPRWTPGTDVVQHFLDAAISLG